MAAEEEEYEIVGPLKVTTGYHPFIELSEETKLPMDISFGSDDRKSMEIHTPFSDLSNYKTEEDDENFFADFVLLSSKQESKRLEDANREEEEEKIKPPPEERSLSTSTQFCIGDKECEDLYIESLYTIKYVLGGGSSGQGACLEDLYNYAQKAFHISDEVHNHLLDIAQQAKPPLPIVKVTVYEAQGLKAKDANGFSDPYCMLGIHLGSTSESRRNSLGDDFVVVNKRESFSEDLPAKFIRTTTVKRETLNPEWNEKFWFDIDDLSFDSLHVDVWDHDDETSVFDSVRKLNEVSGMKGLKRFFKKIAQSSRAGCGESIDDFLGCVSIPLNSLPPLPVDKWFTLEGRSNRSNVQGRIHLKLELGTREDRGVTATEDNLKEVIEHQKLLWIFIEHALSNYNGPTYLWTGDLSQEALIILHQHAIQGDVTELQQVICHWIMYSRKHREVCLEYALLLQLLEELDRLWNTEESVSKDEEAALSESFNLFLDYCMDLLIKHRDLFPPANTQAWHKLKFMLKCLVFLHEMSAFRNCCPSRKPLSLEITSVLERGTIEWFNKEHAYSLPQQLTDETQLKSLIEVTEAMNRDMIKAEMHYNFLFEDAVGINYFVLIYKQLDKMVESKFSSEIKKICITVGSSGLNNTDMKTGTLIFELYMTLQKFSKFKDNLPQGIDVAVANFYLWFSDAVHYWFSMAKNKAKQRIQKAVDLDEFQIVDPCVKYSSSAVDTATCFAQIIEFWRQLSWPDMEASYAVVMKVLEAICSGAMFYASLCNLRLVESDYYASKDGFDVTDRVCIVINNIEHIQEEIVSISNKLELQKFVHCVDEYDGRDVVDQCKSSFYGLLKSAEEDMVNSVTHIARGIGAKMRDDVKRHVIYLASMLKELTAEKAVSPLMDYLEENLINLNDNILRVTFSRVLEVIWNVILQELNLCLKSHILKERCPFYEQLERSLKILLDYFCGDGSGLDLSVLQNSMYQELQQLVTLYRTESSKLIEFYCLQRMEQQKHATAKCGHLAIKAYYDSADETICIEILNASGLTPFDSNGFSDPFVIVELHPKHLFPDYKQQRTKVHKKTLFPLFDETIKFRVPISECQVEAALLSFIVMDYDIMRADDFEGEAYISLRSLPGVGGEKIEDVSQTNLVLMHSDDKNKYLSVLENRTWDRLAQEFVKQERMKHFRTREAHV